MPALNHVQSFNNWAGGTYPQGGETQTALGPTPVFRDAKDRQLVSWGASPDTLFPDGYLGTQAATTRRSDKLVDATYRTNRPAYSRGVHKGERINPGDYLWPREFNLMTGLEYEEQGLKFAPNGAAPVRLVNDGKTGPLIPQGIDRPEMSFMDMQRQSMLRHLLPTCR